MKKEPEIQTTFRIPASLHAGLARIAEKEDRSMSQIFREFARNYIAASDRKERQKQAG